ERGYRLACQTTVEGDLVVKIPPESKLDRSVLKRKEKDKDIDQFGLTAKKLTIEEVFDSTPYVVKKYLELTKPTIENNMSDLQRIIQALKKEYDYETLEVDFKSIKYIPDTLRKSDWKITVLLQEKEGYIPKIIGVEEGDTRNNHYAIAVDIGTTTLYVQLLDLNKREVLAEASDYNPQISYGEDVITRILYATKGEGLKILQEVLIKSLNSLIDEVVKEANIEKKYLSSIVTAGNTTMTHLFLGINPKYIREDPYVPVANFFPFLRAKNLGFDLSEHTVLYTMPNIASYVGGDIVAGVVACGIHLASELVLFIDVGTNGEIVLGNQEWMVTASCSAGPA
ncbi:MAG: ASKHA domain-containing protein, partial [Thermodesulfobacteriaceae bacterium]|nr:ASKHA domain-containing protein [Thermodesulfobacteriaceae bacterium]